MNITTILQRQCACCHKDTTNFKFCSLSCAVTFNNKFYPNKRKPCWTDNALIEAIKNSKSFLQVCQKLYPKPGGRNYKTIQRHIKRLNLDISHFNECVQKIPFYCIYCAKELNRKKRQNLYCSFSCQHQFQRSEYIKRWLVGQETGGTHQVSHHIRRWLFEQRGEQCWQCGWNKKHASDGRCPLEVDHIDGHYANNRPENLRLLCPNCHSLTSTYRARNKGNGRHVRRQRYANGQSF